jgi:hypothetical protein
MYCVESNRDLPANFCSRAFISRVVNYTKPLHHILVNDDHPDDVLTNEIVAALGDPFEPPYNLTGRAWLLGYLETTIHGNIESSTILKWKSVINDSINAYAIIHLRC